MKLESKSGRRSTAFLKPRERRNVYGDVPRKTGKLRRSVINDSPTDFTTMTWSLLTELGISSFTSSMNILPLRGSRNRAHVETDF